MGELWPKVALPSRFPVVVSRLLSTTILIGRDMEMAKGLMITTTHSGPWRANVDNLFVGNFLRHR